MSTARRIAADVAALRREVGLDVIVLVLCGGGGGRDGILA
jgi:hypothetical protein